MLRRGTTPTLTFTLPFDASTIDLLNIAFAQGGKIIFEKKLNDCTLEEKNVSVELSEEDTLNLSDSKRLVEIQLRVARGSARMASQIITTSVDRILKDGCLNEI